MWDEDDEHDRGEEHDPIVREGRTKVNPTEGKRWRNLIKRTDPMVQS